VAWFGEAKGNQIFDFAFGIDARPVEVNRERQQISRMLTLKQDSNVFEFIKPSLDFLSELVFNEASRLKKRFKTISLIAINERFEASTKSKTKTTGFSSAEEMKELCKQLLKEFLQESFIKMRRVGVRVSNFDEDPGLQRKLFEF